MVANGEKRELIPRFIWLGLVFVLALGAIIRIGELDTYGPTPGDDISYLNNVRETYAALRRARPDPAFGLRLAGPFLVANRLSQTRYHQMAFTSLAKPLYILKLALIEGTVGLTLYRQQLALALVGVLSIGLVFLVGRCLFGSRAGLAAAFLMAISPWAVRYSTYGVPTADSLFLLLLALWSLLAPRRLYLVTGFILGATVMLNPTVIWPVLIIALLAVLRAWLRLIGAAAGTPGSKFRLARSLLALVSGFILIPLLWEFGNWLACSRSGIIYSSFWKALQETAADNIEHAILLPVDPLFWFRLVGATEGWPQLFLWILSLGWLLRAVKKRKSLTRFPLLALLVALLGTIIAATWSASTQCSRHYVFAWSLGTIMIGGMVSSCFDRRKKQTDRVDPLSASVTSLPEDFPGEGKMNPRGEVRRVIFGLTVILLLIWSVGSAGKHLFRYRYSRQGGYRLARWIEENIPAGRVIAPANQPDNLWPGVPRFHNWPELEQREEKSGPLYIVYGDYLAITRGIWDFPYDMFQIAQACRAVEAESFRAGTHLSEPSFLYENDDYYWGFIRQKNVAFDPDVRVIPAADVLAFRSNPPWPEDATIITWRHADGDWGYNVYRPFVRFLVFPYRSAWPALGLIGILLILVLWFCRPPRLEIRSWFRRHRTVLALGAVLIITLIFRSHGLKEFSQMGGDDVEYRVYVEKGRRFPAFRDLGFFAPFVLASQLSQLDVNQTITSFAKPLFLLERCLSEYTLGQSVQLIHLWSCLQGLATVLVIYFIGRLLGGPAVGLVASLFWAFSPWAVTYSTWGIHVAGGVLYFSLAVWAYLHYRSSPSNTRAFLAGLLLGISFLYSSSNLWPGFCLLLIDLANRVSRMIRPGERRGKTLLRGAVFALGIVVIWLGWEALSWSCARLLGSRQLFFPQVVLSTMRDNVLHARALPVDLLFFWRHLFVSEGPLVGLGAVLSVVFVLGRVVRRRAPEPVAILLALLFGVSVTMNYAGGSQVIRHFFPAWVPLTLLSGWAVSRLVRRKPKSRWIIGGLLIFLVFAQWHRLDVFRLARWAPARVRSWARINFVPESVATLACQNMSLWPTLRPITSWKELGLLAGRTPPGVMMYSDYIEIAHGSWFYSFREYYEISEIARRAQGDLFRTPSYLSYRPSLFENEFYYWGLYRDPFPDFDPAIRLLPTGKLVEDWNEVKSDPKLLAGLWAPARRPPPLRLPARPHDIQRPFLRARPRPSYRAHLTLSLLLLLGLAWLARAPADPDNLRLDQRGEAG